MFAVIVLGIGFIMIAAMFPVSISQSRLTVEETSAAAIARNAYATSTRIAENGDSAPQAPLMPATDLYQSPPARQNAQVQPGPSFIIPARKQVAVPGKVLSFNDPRLSDGSAAAAAGTVNYQGNLWSAINSSLLLPADNRYAWVPMYRRDRIYYNNSDGDLTVPANLNDPAMTKIDSPFAQVYFIPIAVRNRSLYDVNPANNGPGNDLNFGGARPANFEPRMIQLKVLPNANTVGGYAFFVASPATGDPLFGGATRFRTGAEAVAEGAFVIVSDDKFVNADFGRMNGRIYRIGSRRSDLDQSFGGTAYTAWEPAPGSEFTPDGGADGNLTYRPPNVPPDADDIIGIGNQAGDITGLNPATVASGPARAFVVGRNPTAGAQFEGPAQDVGAFVTFIKVN
jgi:hypothetical protein